MAFYATTQTPKRKPNATVMAYSALESFISNYDAQLGNQTGVLSSQDFYQNATWHSANW